MYRLQSADACRCGWLDWHLLRQQLNSVANYTTDAHCG